MKNFVQINYNNIEENEEYNKIINTVVKKCFEEEGLDNIKIYINIILTNPEEIKRINKEYRNIDRETDVISFALEDEKKEDFTKTRLLGDIYISIDKAKEQAISYEHSLERELSFLAVHGLLHLLGYDHMTKEDEKIMFTKQKEILYGKRFARIEEK